MKIVPVEVIEKLKNKWSNAYGTKLINELLSHAIEITEEDIARKLRSEVDRVISELDRVIHPERTWDTTDETEKDYWLKLAKAIMSLLEVK